MKKRIIIGGIIGASFFVGCSQNKQHVEKEEVATKEKELEMYVDSELAKLMRKMYKENKALGKRIEKGEIPESFPEDFYKMHTAASTPGMIENKDTYDALADQYLKNMEAILDAENPAAAKIAYNDMVMTCATCHQVYCQGPLPKIRKMRLKLDEAED